MGLRKKDSKHSRIVKKRVIATVSVLLAVTAALGAFAFGAVKLFHTFLPEGLEGLSAAGNDGTASREETEEYSEEKQEASEAGTENTEQAVQDLTGGTEEEDFPEVSPEELAEEYEELVSAPMSEGGILEVEDLIASMTLEQKTAQLFFVTPEQLTHVGTVTEAGDATKTALQDRPVGGIIYFSRNFEDPEQTRTLLARTQEYAAESIGVPVFLASDEEGGEIRRVTGNEALGTEQVSSMAEIGASGDPSGAEQAGRTIGACLREYGFNLDLAPVVDVGLEDGSSAIGTRAFGTDGKLVAAMAAAFCDGLREEGILACYKHFPGFGRASANTDDTPVSLDTSLEEFRSSDLIPYAEEYRNDVPIIMVGNMACPRVTGSDDPACLSETLVTDILRNELGFSGIVITDALQAAAVTERYGSGDAAVAAVKAGADLILMPENFEEAYDALYQAVKEGEIPESRLDESLHRILKVKLSLRRESGEKEEG